MTSPTRDRDKQASRRLVLHRRLRFWILVLICVTFVGCLLQVRAQLRLLSSKQPRVLPVVVAKADHKDMPVYLNGLGAVTPISNITVRTQINGTLFKVLFREGQMVKAGDLLAQVDPRPYEAQLLEYQGQLIRDKALLANAKLDLARYQTLWRQNSTSQQTLATQQSLVGQYEGAIQIDQGLINQTKINLIYCNITAPVSGRVGLRLIDPGNYVQTSDTNGIAVITSLNPITVVFSLAEDSIPQIITRLNASEKLSVRVYNRDQTIYLATGVLITIDNEVDPTTGMVRLRAQFINDDNKLFPNQFVNARLLVEMLKNATVIPVAAIQYGNNGSYVYLYNPATQTVSFRAIKVSVTEGNDAAIASGLTAGESVVIQGADNLTNGATVKLVSPLTPVMTNTTSIFAHANNLNHGRELA